MKYECEKNQQTEMNLNETFNYSFAAPDGI